MAVCVCKSVKKQPEHKITEPVGMLSSQSSSQPVGQQSGTNSAGCCGILTERTSGFYLSDL